MLQRFFCYKESQAFNLHGNTGGKKTIFTFFVRWASQQELQDE